jgi:nucleoside-diphosphate-sugar epimerase
MSVVLVTGATGFIGLHLVEALVRRGDRVRCLVRPSSRIEPLRALGVGLATAEFDDLPALIDAVAGADTVFHAAGLIRAFSKGEFYRVNELGTARLAEACAAQASPPRLVLVSSIAAAGPAPLGQVRREDDRPAPLSHYGQSKLAAERAAQEFAGRMPLTIVRPGFVFGPRDSVFAKIVRAIRHFHSHLCPGWHPPALSYIHVSDLVDLLLAAAERGNRVPAYEESYTGRGRYFAVAAEHPTYAELGLLLRTMLARPYAPVIRVPGPLAWFAGGLSEWFGRLRGTPEELCFDKIRDAIVPSWACSGEAARRDLGFAPAKPLPQRLAETVEWYRANGWF